MAAISLRDSAKAYEPKTTKNIAEVEVVNLDVPIVERTAKDKEGKDFSFFVALINDEEYRVPNSVLADIKTIIASKPALKTIRVIKKGQGMATSYQVIPLD